MPLPPSAPRQSPPSTVGVPLAGSNPLPSRHRSAAESWPLARRAQEIRPRYGGPNRTQPQKGSPWDPSLLSVQRRSGSAARCGTRRGSRKEPGGAGFPIRPRHDDCGPQRRPCFFHLYHFWYNSELNPPGPSSTAGTRCTNERRAGYLQERANSSATTRANSELPQNHVSLEVPFVNNHRPLPYPTRGGWFRPTYPGRTALRSRPSPTLFPRPKVQSGSGRMTEWPTGALEYRYGRSRRRPFKVP
jgi:hypothetical protein